MPSDEELMLMFKHGDSPAFDLLFEKYRSPVFNFIYRMLGRDRDSAEDLLSEIFTKAAMGRDSYEPRAMFSTWLFAIARNHCLNFLKSRYYTNTRNTASLEAGPGGNLPPLSDTLAAKNTPAPADCAGFKELLEQVISALPEKYREVFLLHTVNDFTHQEVSAILSMNPATVRIDYHRAKMIIKEKMGSTLKGE